MPRSRDLAIFMLMTTDDRQIKLIALLVAAHAHGIIIIIYTYTCTYNSTRFEHVYSEKVTYNRFDLINLTSQLIDAT